jgi:hypothetical protein
MLLSVSHRFIFVHVPKTAGSSLHNALLPYARPDTRTFWRRVSRWLPIVESPERAHFRIHAPASEIRAKLSPEVYDRFLSFAVVRNPFDHAVSHYEYMKQYRSPRIARRFADMSFSDYLRFRLAPRRPWDRLFARMPDQSYFLVDRAGRLLVSRLLHFETLSEEFRDLAAELGLTSRELPSVNRTEARSKERPFESYYDAETEALVRRLYARDLALLGYDGAAR